MIFQGVVDNLELNREKRLRGDVVAIPYPYRRLSEYLPGIEQAKYYIVTGAQKSAKCFGKGTKVIMYDGSIKNIEDINIGDKVIGPDSLPKTVLNTGKGKQKMFKIIQEFGDDIVVNSDHVLYLYKYKDSKHRPGQFEDYVTMTVSEYLKLSNYQKSLYRHTKTKALKFNNNYTYNIDPYLIGLWYGDGCVNEIRITNTDPEIIKYLYNFADQNNLKIHNCGTKKISYYLSDKIEIKCYNKKTNEEKIYSTTKEAANDLGIKHAVYIFREPSKGKKTDNYIFSRNKNIGEFKSKFFSKIPKEKDYIPNFIKQGNLETRRSFFAGFIDSDGCKSNYISYEICQKRYNLILDLKDIANSLGLRTSIRKEKIKKIYYYTLSVYGKEVFNLPIKISRKKPELKKTRGSELINRFKIIPLKNNKYYGITLGGDHLFVLKDGTVVHNTQFTDFTFVFSVIDWYIENRYKTNIKPKILYFSLEVSRELKILSAISYKLFTSYKILISPQKLRSVFKNYILDEKILHIIKSKEFTSWLETFEEIVEIHEDIRNPYGIYKTVKAYAESHGKYEYEDIPWEENGLIKTKKVIKKYIPDNPDEFVEIICDHISLMQPERGGTLHQAIQDYSSNYCLLFRDRFKYIPINVQQQSADSQTSAYDYRGDLVIDRVKPTPFGLGDNKLTVRDCNLMFGLFYPYYYNIKNYGNVDLNKIGDYHRELSILANRDGFSNLKINLMFLGAGNHFEEIPKNINENYYNLIKEYVKKEY